MARTAIMNRVRIMVLIAITALSSACASTLQTRDVRPSGFLGEHSSLLQAGLEDEALRTYKKPTVHWAEYKKIILKPVAIWEGFSSKLGNQQRQELVRLAGAFEDRLYLKLSKDYEMVEQPTAGTMLIQVAITDAEESWIGPAVLSKAIPQLQEMGRIWVGLRGAPAFTGEITAQFKIHDAQTGELLAVGADRRVSGRKLFDHEVFNSWSDVKNSLEFWTDLTTYRLCVLRGETGCVEPRT
ncbi:MAG: DUF3313 domain-containing protein [Nitrospira sp.]